MYKLNKIYFIILTIIFGFFSCKPNKETKNTSLDKEIEQKVDSVLSLMHIDEKIGQMVQYAARSYY